jgi:RNA polymerase sigma-70 factor (ECF subfamily)
MVLLQYAARDQDDMSFPTTRWSLILATAHSPAAHAAWSELAARYRSSVIAYFRVRHGRDQAEDLAQRFFADSIAGGWWARADAERGNFRMFLRTLLKRYGARHAERATPGDAMASIDLAASDDPGPDAAYDRDFAHTLVARALARLEQENAGARELLPFVLERGDGGELKQLALRAGIAHNTLVQRLRRLRLRFRAILREDLAELLADPADVDRELAALQGALS